MHGTCQDKAAFFKAQEIGNLLWAFGKVHAQYLWTFFRSYIRFFVVGVIIWFTLFLAVLYNRVCDAVFSATSPRNID